MDYTWSPISVSVNEHRRKAPTWGPPRIPECMSSPDPFPSACITPKSVAMNDNATPLPRVIGLDCHPDSFTAAILSGSTPAQAIVERTFNKVPIGQLAKWAQQNTQPGDLLVLEASGNSFEIVRCLKRAGRTAQVLESCQIGKLKEAHANNDKISAVRIGKAYLAGTAKTVWVPDPLTQERRDWFHAYRKTVKRTTQVTNRIRSYLSDNGVRLVSKAPVLEQQTLITKERTWSARQGQVLEGFFLELRHAHEQRAHWSSLIAQEVICDERLLSLVRLCGIRDVIAFSLGAIVGDIERFESPKKLVAYAGLYPSFDDSGNGEWTGGIGGHGRRDLRSLLVEAAQAVLRSRHPLAKWGKALLARKGSYKLVVAAMARKLTVAIWYLMKGRWTSLEEIDSALSAKITKIITKVGTEGLKQMKRTRKSLREQINRTLKETRIYQLDPERKFTPAPS